MHYNPSTHASDSTKQYKFGTYSWNKVNSKVKGNIINLVWDHVRDPVWHNTLLTIKFMDSYES